MAAGTHEVTDYRSRWARNCRLAQLLGAPELTRRRSPTCRLKKHAARNHGAVDAQNVAANQLGSAEIMGLQKTMGLPKRMRRRKR